MTKILRDDLRAIFTTRDTWYRAVRTFLQAFLTVTGLTIVDVLSGDVTLSLVIAGVSGALVPVFDIFTGPVNNAFREFRQRQ